MVVSVRAGFAVCLGVLSLTAAGSRPSIAAPALTAQQAMPVPAVVTEAPAYFVLGDRSDAPIETADAVAEPATDLANEPAFADEDQTRAPASNDLGAEARCLAVAVYYEARGEPLSGQLAVAHVVMNRAHSGRFAATLCGVVRQPGQFSFRGRSFAPPENADWTKAVAVARAAMDGTGANPARGALYFHANYVAPGWDRPQIAQIGHHVFYR